MEIKVEIARKEQFLLFLQCFQKACFPGASEGVIVWEWVNTIIVAFGTLSLSITNLGCYMSGAQVFWKHYEQFLLLPHWFLPIWITFCHFLQALNCCLQTRLVWKSLKFVVQERVIAQDQTAPDIHHGLLHGDVQWKSRLKIGIFLACVYTNLRSISILCIWCVKVGLG